MRFERIKYTVFGLLITGLVIGLLGAFLYEEGSVQYTIAAVLAAVMLIAGILTGILGARCPYCGKVLFVKMLKLKKCPRCGKKLDERKS